MAHILTCDKHWRIENGLYKLIGIDGDADQRWGTYVRSILAFSAVSVLLLYALMRLQHYLMLSLGMPNDPARPGLEHGLVLRDQHQLAELLR